MAGYALRMNGIFLDAFAEQEVSFSVESALLSDSILPGILSMPFSLPLSKKNKQLLGNLDLLDFWEYDTSYDCELWLEGNYFRSGRILINSADKDSADITFSEFDAEKQFDDKNINDLVYPQYDISIDRDDDMAPLPAFYAEILARLEDDYAGEKDWVTPTIYNINAEGILDIVRIPESFPIERGRHQNLIRLGNVDERFGSIRLEHNLLGFYEELTDHFASKTVQTGEYNAFSAFLYVNYVLKKVFKEVGLIIDYNKLSEEEYHQLVLYTNRAICFWPDYTTGYVQTMSARLYEDKIDISQFVPEISIKDFLTAIKNTFCLVYLPDYTSNTIHIKCKSDIIAEMQEIDFTEKSNPYTKWEKNSYETYKALTYGNFIERADLPDTKDYIFLGNLQNAAALPAFSGDKEYYYLRDEDKLMIYNAGTGTWTDLAKNGINGTVNLYFQRNAKNKLDLQTDTPKNASFMPREVEIYGKDTVDDPSFQQRKFKFYCPTLPYSLTTDSSIVDKGPNDNGKMNNLFLMFYRGLKDSVYEDSYYGNQTWQFPFASIDAKPAFWNGTDPDEYECSLEMFGDKGIYEKLHKKWRSTFDKTRTVYSDMRLHAHEMSLALNSKIRIQNSSYILKKLTFKASPSQLKPCKAEMYQIML